jgi:inner membrane transporter RhtA
MLLPVVSILAIQTGAAFSKTLFDQVGPAGSLLLRMLVAGAVLLAVTRPRITGRPRGALAAACAFGVIIACMNLSFFEAIDRIPLAVAVTIQCMGPLSVGVFASRRLLDAAWAVLGGLGVVLVNWGHYGGTMHWSGVAFAGLAALGWVGYILLAQRVGRVFPAADGLAIAIGVGAAVVLPFGVTAGGTSLLEPEVLAAGAAIGVFGTAIPYLLELEALRRISAATFGVLMSLEPVVAALSGFFVLSESLRPPQIAGIGIAATASAAMAMTAERQIP